MSTVASYTYNAWGEILTATGTMAEINPLRYRGYYDTETGWYYLQSHYYDPILHRFINADSYASTGQGFIGTNMFAYCNNNPCFYIDPSGLLSTYSVVYETTIPLGNGIKLKVCIKCDATLWEEYGASFSFDADDFTHMTFTMKAKTGNKTAFTAEFSPVLTGDSGIALRWGDETTGVFVELSDGLYIGTSTIVNYFGFDIEIAFAIGASSEEALKQSILSGKYRLKTTTGKSSTGSGAAGFAGGFGGMSSNPYSPSSGPCGGFGLTIGGAWFIWMAQTK